MFICTFIVIYLYVISKVRKGVSCSGMLLHSILFCRSYADIVYNILYYTILYYTILYYTMLYYTRLYYTILYYNIHKTIHI